MVSSRRSANAATPASTSPAAPSPPVARTARDYYTEALNLLRAGRRPTADDLVAKLKGSKTTAHNRLNEFWDQWLPDYLGSLQPDAPDPVGHALRKVWAIAMEHADTKAADRLSADKRDLANAQARLASDQSALADGQRQLETDRAALTEELSELRVKLRQSEQLLIDAKRDREHAEREAGKSEERAATARSDIAKLQHDLDVLRAANTKLQSQHREERAELKQVASDLKTAYHDSEQKLRVQLDAEKTAHRNTKSDLQREIHNLEARLERATRASPPARSAARKAKPTRRA